MRYFRVVVNRKNLDDYHENEEPDGIPVHVVDQNEELIFDGSLFVRWLRFGSKNGNCLELDAVVCAHLRTACGVEAEVQAPASSSESEEDNSAVQAGSSTDTQSPAWCRRVWRYVRQEVAKTTLSSLG